MVTLVVVGGRLLEVDVTYDSGEGGGSVEDDNKDGSDGNLSDKHRINSNKSFDKATIGGQNTYQIKSITIANN